MTTTSEDKPETSMPGISFARIILKGLALFLVVNFLLGFFDPMPTLGKLSAYNHLFPGRQRFPYADNPQHAYSLSLFNLDAMFASHELSAGPKPPSEYRVLLIGDSSTWGFLLKPDETLSANLNAARYTLPDGRPVKVYNLGYPVMSLTKDLLILSRAVKYQPDLIVWLVTLESFPYDKQLFPPLLQHNAPAVRDLIQKYDLTLNPDDPSLLPETYWDRTVIGSRRALADLLRLQLYGVMWAATGIDQDIPDTYIPRTEDLSADLSFHDLQPPHLVTSQLGFELLKAGVRAAGKVPVLLVNEPVFISQGQNSDIRYNYYYPRWAYDDYRVLFTEQCQQNGWTCADLWNAIPADQFTNTAVHLSPQGSAMLSERIGGLILDNAVSKP